MQIIEAIKAAIRPRVPAVAVQKDVSPVLNSPRAWKTIIEPFAGAWQRGITESRENLLTYSTLYACLTRISSDIAKLPFMLKQRDSRGLWRETRNPAYDPVLRKPNRYQSPQQFREAWILSVLTHGNTYVLKERDTRGVVTDLYVLDPVKVVPMVSDMGFVYYQLRADALNSLTGTEQITVPASEIIHDREAPLHHPLIGVAPLAAAWQATRKNWRIIESAAEFFGNKASPGGLLTAPAGMSEEDATKVREFWQQNFTGPNAGRIAIVGADMKFTAMSSSAESSQLVEQLRYSDEQICNAFGVPPHMIGIGSLPQGLKIDDIALSYYNTALSARIERMENLLDAGLSMADGIGVELDLDPLLRMDMQKQAQVEAELVKAGIKAPNEARRRFNLEPVDGGDSPLVQQQNFSLEALAKRDALPDPFAPAAGQQAIAEKQASTDKRVLYTSDQIEDFVTDGDNRSFVVKATGQKKRYRYSWAQEKWLPV